MDGFITLVAICSILAVFYKLVRFLEEKEKKLKEINQKTFYDMIDRKSSQD